ncbi:hypothetical protein QE152_g26227 [Popillia japonica]|uniref:Uncharacterized protein n=1 Tax=Popillia japonica TaxID=7064 RepID=A0AAW1JZB2_POPJA
MFHPPTQYLYTKTKRSEKFWTIFEETDVVLQTNVVGSISSKIAVARKIMTGVDSWEIVASTSPNMSKNGTNLITCSDEKFMGNSCQHFSEYE